MKFDKVQFVYIDIKYLEYLHSIDPEIYFDKNEPNYKLKPHLGILLNNDGREYVIPLISGKDKHKTWADVTASWYRIYDIIDITEDPVRPDDVIVEIKKSAKVNNIENPIIDIFETVNGFHVITKPLNYYKTFKDKFPEIEIHKNNPTLLYYDGEV